MNLLLITFIIVMIYDYAEFPAEFLSRFYSLIFKQKISKYAVKLPKLLGCSFCTTFWTTLLFQFLTGGASIIVMLSLSLCCAFLSKPILYLITIIDKLFSKTLDRLKDIINKI